jgi:carbon-monoxide dehydrogenase medium subunit
MMSINKVNTHIIPIQFHYHAPTSLEQTVELLEKHRKDAKLLAGGTDLIPHMKQRKVEVKHLINLKKIPNLACIKETSEGIKIGALAKLRTIELSPLIKEKLLLLNEAAKTVGSIQIRNLGTIGGNICNASPCADMATSLLAMDTKIHVFGKKGYVDYTIEEFFQDRGEVKLAPDELLTGMTVPIPPKDAGMAFEKIGWTSFDIATVNVAVVVTLKEGKIDYCRISLGACSPKPTRVYQAETILKDEEPTKEVFEEAVYLISACVEPREHWRRAPSEYRRKSSQALAIDALTRAVEQVRRLT